MARGFFNVPKAVNEPVKEYAPGSPEREEVLATYKEMFHSNIDVPMHINGEEVRTGNTKTLHLLMIINMLLGNITPQTNRM